MTRPADERRPTVTLIAAVARNGVIGRDGEMPWRLPSDLKLFKAYTMGKPVVMGRRTWESFPRRPLPGRRNIVVTRNRDYSASGAERAASLDDALQMAATVDGAREICILGGGAIYRQAIGRADRLVITHVLAEIDGDTIFPDIDAAMWREADDEAVSTGAGDSHEMRRTIYERRG